MILYNNIVKISKNRWIGYMLKVALLLASSIYKRREMIFPLITDNSLPQRVIIWKCWPVSPYLQFYS